MRTAFRNIAPLIAGLLLHAVHARAADLHVNLPALVAGPGSTVVIPIDVSANPTGLGIVSVEYRLPLDPAVIATSKSLTDGFIQFWGPPFVNATSSLIAAAAAGLTPLSSGTRRLNTLHLTLKPTAVPGTVMPLAFSDLRFNEGTPSVDFTPGSLTVSTAVDAPNEPRAGRLALASPRPNPAQGPVRLGFTLPEPTHVVLSLHDVQGRLVREIARGTLGAGAHDALWDGRDDAGGELPAGIYLLRLAAGERVLVRRLARAR